MSETIDTSSGLRRSLSVSALGMMGLTVLIYFPVLVTSSLALVPAALGESDGGQALGAMDYADRLRCAVNWHFPFSETSRRCTAYFNQYDANLFFNVLMTTCLISGLVTGPILGWRMTAPPSRTKHIRGRMLLIDDEAEQALSEWSYNEPNPELSPLQLTDYWRMSNFRESEHILDFGSSGSGKTQFFVRLYGAAMARGDRLVLHDVKGDFVSYLPDAFLLSPTDARSGIWDIASDVDTPSKAREFVAYLLPHTGKEKIWVNAARSIATGYLVYLQKTKGKKWTWADAATLNTLSIKQIRIILQEHWREAADYLANEKSVTSQGFVSEVKASLYIFTDLANAWADPNGDRSKISLRQWMYEPREDQQVLILARNSEYAELSSAWVSAVVHYMCTLGVSPELEEDNRRRIWFGLDEFWAMQKQDKITELIRLGRSKGVIVVIGAQSSLQLEDIYGENVTQDWFNNFGTVIVSKHKHGTAADKTASLIGRRQIEKIHDSASMKNDQTQGTTQSYRGEMENVILPSQLQSLLGRFENSPGWFTGMFGARSRPFLRILVLGYGDIAPIVRIPILDVERFDKGFIAAEWTKGQNYKQAHVLSSTVVSFSQTSKKDTRQADWIKQDAEEAEIVEGPEQEQEAQSTTTKQTVKVGSRKLLILNRGKAATHIVVSMYLEKVIRQEHPNLFSDANASTFKTTFKSRGV